jgi:hypothetical protein
MLTRTRTELHVLGIELRLDSRHLELWCGKFLFGVKGQLERRVI